ncbi:MAG: rod shape-determining protein RodA [Armatimonadota bacterium]|nr:rod shape-determining protein RodA [Armatimonadota bacterium]MDR7454686.1 rod shape-determining protein RodA [Armatimonadota bacterium]MDR7456321.1 rod shape-determining protein RodA [Armatimonadota bacterium]MDR7496318.1 rod shape-determining protein RodA [Armatimonadota bacterium]MDR7512468.1 rod shape-determining protein RodA [Armatimonadota bacterium]
MTARWTREVDWVLLGATGLITAYGVVVLLSATHGAAEPAAVLRTRLLHITLGLVALVTAASVDYRRLATAAGPIYVATVALLVAVLVVGDARLGAQRWIVLGPFGGFQPSEVAKLALIVTLARHLDLARSLPRMRALFPFFAHAAVPALLVLRQPDMGTALVLVAILAAMLYVGGARPADLAGLAAAAAVVAPFFWQLLHDYQRRRLTAFLDPAADPLGAGYALIQAKIAIGSGQLFGKGLFAGTQNVLRFIPEQHTDFIFTVVGEELGLAGTLALLALFLVWIWRALRIAAGARDRLGALMAAGVAAMMLFHVVVNVGMTIGLMPVTGIPLPLVSYGGSSLLVTLAATGLLVGIRLRRSGF